MFQPSVYHHPSKDLRVVVRVDDFLCSGEVKDLEWLFDNLAQKFEVKRSMITKDREEEVKYQGRTIGRTYDVTPEGRFEVRRRAPCPTVDAGMVHATLQETWTHQFRRLARSPSTLGRSSTRMMPEEHAEPSPG